MNKIKFLILISFVSLQVNAQMEVLKEVPSEKIGRISNLGLTLFEMTKSGNSYTLEFRDAQYSVIHEYESVSFNDVDDTYNQFYNLIITNMKKPPIEDVKVKLGNNILWLRFKKPLGNGNVMFLTSDAYSIYINEKLLTKLFGKDKNQK